ncbi:uncharacterized protein TNCT_638431 [Trichonephila clavata]|uniref:DUF1758 domain-containing protein n=1 Tax=Trichonephila clavata TaxID=2740835 RepID=A0A8X6K9I7_TRICU|nr:uncharacterized protein TNCT_638431 [Trichonephila clavata]
MQTTKLFNKVETALLDETISLEEKFDLLSICKDQLKEKYETLKKLNSDIQDGIPDTEFENEIENSENYSVRIIESRYKITKFLNERNVHNQSTLLQSALLKNDSRSCNLNSECYMKLSKLTIQKFYGDSSTCLEFWGQFSNAIDNNPNLTHNDKFSYLKSLLGASAHNVVAGFSLSEENYKAAVELLKNRFGRHDLVFNAHMTKLLNLKQVKRASNIKELRELYDSCEIQIRNLNSLGVVAESYGRLLCPIILKLIPSEIALDFNWKRLDYETFNVEELLLFLKKETELREATLSMQNSDQQIISSKKENFKHSPKYSNFRRGTPTASALTTNARNACVFCDNYEHDSISCKVLSIPEKREKLRKEGRCYVCFRKFHVSSKCKFKLTPCKICHGNFHNTSIRLNKLTNESTLPKESNSDVPLTTTAVSHCKIDKKDVCNKEVVLQTIYVNVECERNSQTLLLLFDVESQRTFVTSKLVSKLKAPIIRQENLQIFSFASIKPQTKAFGVTKLRLCNLKDKSRFKVIEALVTDVISNVTISLPRLTQDIKAKLASYYLPDARGSRPREVDILLGADYFYQVSCDRPVEKITNSLFLCDSLFGYSLCSTFEEGGNKMKNAAVLNLSALNAVREDLTCLWDLESLEIRHVEDKILELDGEILNKFENNLKFVNKIYETGLLWKDDKKKLGNDFIAGSKSDDEAFYITMTASNIFKEAGMHLRKFHTNSENLRHMWKENKLSDFQNSNDSLKVLGILWDTNSDVLRFDVQSFPDDWKFNPTKRLVLKAMLKIFDPIGFIAPFSIRMKML